MRKDVVARGPRGQVLLIDSITQLAAGDEGAIVVSGSHGGTSSHANDAALALGVRVGSRVQAAAGWLLR